MKKKLIEKIICFSAAAIVFSFFLLCIFLPKEDYSLSERRELKKFPTLTLSTVLKGDFTKNFDEYASDVFPFRDTFRSIKAYFNYFVLQQKDNNDIYVHDGYIASMDYPYNKESVEYAASRFNYVKDKYLNGSRIFLSVIPDKNVFLAEKAGALHFDVQTLITDIREAMPYAEYIDILPTLSIEDYYKTDSHWNQIMISDTAEVIAEKLGVALQKKKEIHESSLPFYGVYYGQSALKLTPDTISYLTSDEISSMKAFDGQNEKEIPVYDTEKISDKDPYELFLSGPLSLVTVENEKEKGNRELIIFRDSFASAIAPLLAEGYSKVTLIDIRYININYLEGLVNFKNKDILFLYSTAVLNNSETIK